MGNRHARHEYSVFPTPVGSFLSDRGGGFPRSKERGISMQLSTLQRFGFRSGRLKTRGVS